MMRVLLPPLINADGLLPFLSLLGASPQAGAEAVSDVLPEGRRYEGTLVGMTFRQSDVRDFARLLHQAKMSSGLLQQGGNKIIFKP